MEWLGNWYLTYREEHQLLGLASCDPSLARAASLGAEAERVDLYLTARKGTA
jgi:hypothetical protein